MQLKSYIYDDGWSEPLEDTLDSMQSVVFIFASSQQEKIKKPLADIKNVFKKSLIIGSSTAGEILMDEIKDDSFVVTVAQFSHTRVKLFCQHLSSAKDSYDVGSQISTALLEDDLKSLFILSDGLQINGAQLTHGINSNLNDDIIVTGGLAADDDKFKSTWIIANGEIYEHSVVGLGFYGDAIRIGHGFQGGWDHFGIQREVTRSIDNVVYELDGRSILDIYKEYLGEKAKDLPASGLFFPLELQERDSNEITVRTILGIDEKEGSITFASDIPEGSRVSLMKANHNRLIEGAFNAAQGIDLKGYKDEALLSIAISCVGRRLVLKQRTEDELEATLENLPKNTLQVGFYSHGEISPLKSGFCDLHNQTMTLTTIWEKNA